MNRQTKREIILHMIIGIVIICGMVYAEEEKKVTVVRAVSNEVEGEVSAVSKDYIAVVYNRDMEKGIEDEMSFPVDGSVVLEHLKNLSQIAPGDLVRITFDEETVREEGKEVSRRKPKKLSFIRQAVKKPAPAQEPSQEEEDELPIKGLKSE